MNILTHLIYWNLHCNDFDMKDQIGYFPASQAVLDDKHNVDRQVAAVTVQ
jgi:hypothetical protein